MKLVRWRPYRSLLSSRDHLFELKQSHELYKFYQKKVEECDGEIEKLLKQFTAKIDVDKAKLVRCEKTICKKNAVGFDVESYAYGIWDVNVMQIPGMSAGSILQLMGELGSDFVEKFETPAKFCTWSRTRWLMMRVRSD